VRRSLALAALIGSLACAGPPKGQPDPFDSQRLVIMAGGMRMLEGRPAINVALKNKTSDPVWVTATFEAPDGGQDCTCFECIEPGASHVFACPQDELIFDRVYGVRFEVFADEARAQPLEEQATEFLFGSEFRELMKAVRQALEQEQGPG